MSLTSGERLGPYEILAPLGAQAMSGGRKGEIYQARDTRLDRLVAITVFQDRFSESFERQAHAASALDHPHIRRVYYVGPNYLVTELVDGVPLQGPLLPEESVRFAIQIADALEYANQQGFTHGDLKPSNILINHQGVKLLDFGLARVATEPNDDDIYAFGGVLYEMLMGRKVAADRRPVQPAALESVLQRCLADDPAQRWRSAAELKRALSEVFNRRGFRREYAIVLGSVVMLVAGLGLLTMEFPSSKRLNVTDILIPTDFSNTTGDAIFDDTLRTALAIQIEQSPFLKILDDEQIQQDLKQLGRPANARISPAIAHDICMREHQKATIGGSIADLGKAFAITIQAVECRTGATLAREQVQAQGREQVLNAISQAAAGIREQLGEPLGSIPKFDQGRPPSDQGITPSIEAFQAYALGLAQRNQGLDSASIPFFQHAIELDSNFALPYYELYFVYNNSENTRRAAAYLTKAFSLAAHVSELERLRIEGSYYGSVTREYAKAVAAQQHLARAYPRLYQSH